MRTRGPGVHHDERRTEIADAVLAVVADIGLAGVSLTSVAARAAVSPGRVQHYFPTRVALLDAAFVRANALATQRVTAAAGPEPAPRELLTAVLLGLVPDDEDSRTHMRIRQFFNAQALADEDIAERLRVLYADLVAHLAAVLPERGAEPPSQAAVRLVALAEGLAYHVLIGTHTAAAARRQLDSAIDRALAVPC